ncbi:MAG: hypothetical protein HY718_14250, partial [Planctomycetes bacterium]|nr:hypothetical protein [Planctomycetota bacterium]
MRSSAIHSAVRAACVGLLAAAVSTPAPAQSTTTQPASAPAATTEPATTAWGAGIPARLLASTQAAATEPATSPSATSQPSPTTTSGPATGPQGVDTPGLAIRNDDVVVFLGDDLVDTPRPTSTNSFPMLVETFMTARYPDLRARYINVGWSGDTVARALLRLDRDMLSHRPTAVVVCLGLNDPEYLPFAEERLAAYRQDLLNLLAKCREAGARVWLMSPPSVDEEKGRKVRVQRAGRPGMTDLQAVGYNSTLQRYAGAMKEAAEQTDSGFVDWFAESAAARARGRQIDPDFALTTDGLNPTDRTHAMAAAALLEAWGAKPIEVTLELTWASGDVKVASHLAPVNVARAEINAAGQRRIVVRNLPLP